MSEPIRVQFQCTYPDFREASLGHAAAQSPGGKLPKMWARMAGWLVFIGLAIVWALLIRTPGRPSVATPHAPVTLPSGGALTVRFLYASLFSLMYCLSYGILLARLLLKRPRPAWLAPMKRQRWGAVLFGVCMGGVALLFGRALTLQGQDTLATDPSGYEMLLASLPSILFLVLVTTFAFAYRRTDVKRRWEGQHFLHRPYTLDADDAGMTLEEAKSMNRYHWDYFPGFRETLNTLLLYVSPYGFWVIPKRAFTSREELEAFKSLLLTHVKTGTLLPTSSAFPVRLLPASLPPIAQRASDVQNPPGS
jgi:hypothetical protein